MALPRGAQAGRRSVRGGSGSRSGTESSGGKGASAACTGRIGAVGRETTGVPARCMRRRWSCIGRLATAAQGIVLSNLGLAAQMQGKPSGHTDCPRKAIELLERRRIGLLPGVWPGGSRRSCGGPGKPRASRAAIWVRPSMFWRTWASITSPPTDPRSGAMRPRYAAQLDPEPARLRGRKAGRCRFRRLSPTRWGRMAGPGDERHCGFAHSRKVRLGSHHAA